VGPDTVLWTISNDDPQKLRELREYEGLAMPFLLDPGAETIKKYGVYNEQSDRVIPHPTALIIDKQGVVRYVRVDEDYKIRPSVEELLEALNGL
jgi:peroxiredoxin